VNQHNDSKRGIEKDDIIRLAILFFALSAFAFVAMGWLSPPSKKAYNPQQAHSSKSISDEMFVPPPDVHPIYKTAKKQTDREIEQWRADRSDLAAQWKTADMAQLAFRVGILGIVLLGWTLFETRNASQSARATLVVAQRTLINSRESSMAELQPVITLEKSKFAFKNIVYDELGGAIGITPERENFYKFSALINIKNWGPTPVFYIEIGGYGEIFAQDNDIKPEHPDLIGFDGSITGKTEMIAPNETKEVEIVCILRCNNSKEGMINFSELFIHLHGDINFDDRFTLSMPQWQSRLFSL